ncbi:MAG: trimeric intracellular cation channel family protein [Saprospiraceae bacterium]|nr:trimeric intracellular cation channel family protein [Saprospiraceae bacterium]
MTWVYLIDLFGTCVFAISGVTTAIEKKFDLVGTLVIGFVTAVGGGTLRDLLLGNLPVGWLSNRDYFLAILLGYVLAYIFKAQALEFKKSMFLFDTVGIALFTVLGIETTRKLGMSVEVCLLMGVVSACFGGVLRDTLTNEIPLIFRKEIYATACLAGGMVYLLLATVCPIRAVNIGAAMATVFLIRYFSVRRGWSLRLWV